MHRFRGRIPCALGTALLAIAVSAPAFAASPSLEPRALLAAGRADDAIQLLNSTIQSSPNNAEAHHLLSRVYYALENWDQAIASGQRAVNAARNNSNYHLWLGKAYGMKAQRAGGFTAMRYAGKARDEFVKAVQLDGSSVEAHSVLSDYYIDAPGFLGGGTDKARREAEQVAAFSAPAAHRIKAQLFEKDKKFKEAEAEYKAAIAKSSNPAAQWIDLAAFYRRTGRLPEMESAIQQAVNSDKKHGKLLYDAARILVKANRNFPAAEEMLRKYLASSELSDEAPAFQAHYLLGQIMEKQGDKKGAANEYRAALAMARDYQAAQNALKRLQE
ncbi:MAG: tetratricopeptide repeat protein [Acidobacteriales bacterium]|nr:tetratricopeptide repeat protein [Terriglobales bacterium]